MREFNIYSTAKDKWYSFIWAARELGGYRTRAA